MTKLKLDTFTRAYLEAALWTSDPDPGSGEWAEHDDWTIENIDSVAITDAIEDCRAFQEEYKSLLAHAGTDAQNGHNFFLTRNGHGAGFWDRGYKEEIGRKLTDAAHAYGTHEADTEAIEGVIYFHN